MVTPALILMSMLKKLNFCTIRKSPQVYIRVTMNAPNVTLAFRKGTRQRKGLLTEFLIGVPISNIFANSVGYSRQGLNGMRVDGIQALFTV